VLDGDSNPPTRGATFGDILYIGLSWYWSGSLWAGKRPRYGNQPPCVWATLRRYSTFCILYMKLFVGGR